METTGTGSHGMQATAQLATRSTQQQLEVRGYPITRRLFALAATQLSDPVITPHCHTEATTTKSVMTTGTIDVIPMYLARGNAAEEEGRTASGGSLMMQHAMKAALKSFDELRSRV